MSRPGRAYADDDAVSEIRVLKAKLEQLEQRVDGQGRKQQVFEAQAKTVPATPGACKALPVDPAILNANESRSRGCAWGVVSPEYHRLW